MGLGKQRSPTLFMHSSICIPNAKIYVYQTYIKMPRAYLYSQTAFYFMNHHFFWCPKYKRKVIEGWIEGHLKELSNWKLEKRTRLRSHCSWNYARSRPSVYTVPSYINAKQNHWSQKGIYVKDTTTGFHWAEIRSRLTTLWTRSYFVSTHGYISSERINKYVEEQKCW